MHLLKRAFLLLITAAMMSAQTPPTPAPSHAPTMAQPTPSIGAASRIDQPPPSYQFPNGRSFVYDAEWRLWNAGTATLTVENEGATHKVTGAASSIGFAAVL